MRITVDDISKFNNNAATWLSALVKANYGVKVDFSRYNLLTSRHDTPLAINLNSSKPQDLYANIILLINGYVEYSMTAKDQYGRLPYEASFQYKHDILKKNLVQGYIEDLLRSHNTTLEHKKSRIVISHDIDTLHNGYIYELFRGVKEVNANLIFRVLIAYALKRPVWYNIDIILDLLDRYDFKAIFYFITENGWSKDRIKNADYHMKDDKASPVLSAIQGNGHEIGLHKSSLDTSLDEEYIKLPKSSVKSNRHHFLRYRIPQLYRDLSESVIDTDCSLCFPYNMGFRNNYGLPFRPFDLEIGEELDVLEIPFQIMDGMLATKTKKDQDTSLEEVIDFFETHKYDTILGVLWHNTELSEVSHKHSFELFKGILKYLYESDMSTVTPNQLLSEYNQELGRL